MTRSLLSALLITFFISSPFQALGEESELSPPADSLAGLLGEDLGYDIAFLWFDRLAEGRLSFSAGDRPGTYRAVLEAQTLGVAAWLTRDRSHKYVSLMEDGPDGRLRALVHEAHTLKGKGKDREDSFKRYTFDYEKGQVRYERIRDGKVRRDEFIPLTGSEPPHDILTAFYNFRTGRIGAVIPEERYTIPTFSHRGISDIVVETLPLSERKQHPFFPRRGGLLAQVKVDEEVFDTGGGSVFVWFDDQGKPARVIVENVIGLGNVRGTMK